MTQPLLPPEHLQWHPTHWVREHGFPVVMLWDNSLCYWAKFGNRGIYMPENLAHSGCTYIAPAYPPTEEEAAKLREVP